MNHKIEAMDSADETGEVVIERATAPHGSAAPTEAASTDVVYGYECLQPGGQGIWCEFFSRQKPGSEGSEWLRNVRQYVPASQRAAAPTVCTLPPTGWHCTRAPGHEGPCAAVPTEVCADDYTPEQMAIYQHGVEDGKLIARGMARFNAVRAAAPVSGGELAALRKYGTHLYTCACVDGGEIDPGLEEYCDCGLNAILETNPARAAVSASQAAPVGGDLHPDAVAVTCFADAMKDKMAKSRAKGRSGWDDPEQCSIESLQSMLLDHLSKGDPIDVANFCMMLWSRGAAVSASQAAPVGGDVTLFKHNERKPPLPEPDDQTELGARRWAVTALCNYGTECFIAGEKAQARAAVAAAKVPTGERQGWEAAAKALQERAAGHFRNKDYKLQDECLQCASMLHDMKPLAAPVEQGQDAAPSEKAAAGSAVEVKRGETCPCNQPREWCMSNDCPSAVPGSPAPVGAGVVPESWREQQFLDAARRALVSLAHAAEKHGIYQTDYERFAAAVEKFAATPTAATAHPVAVDDQVRDQALEEAAKQCEDIYSWRGAFNAGLLHTSNLKACAAAIRSLKSRTTAHGGAQGEQARTQEGGEA